MEPSYGTLTYKVTSPKWREFKERPLVSLLGIIRLVRQEVLRICLRTWICHCSRKRERSFDSRSSSRWLRGWCQQYHRILTLHQLPTSVKFVPPDSLTLKRQILLTLQTIVSALRYNIVKQLWEDTRFLFAPYPSGTVSVSSRWHKDCGKLPSKLSARLVKF